MTIVWLDQGSERIPAMGFRSRIVACAAAAAAVPLTLLATSQDAPGPMTVGAAALGAGWFILCVGRLLLPIRDAARAVEACAQGQPLPAQPAPQNDEVGQINANARLIAERLGGATRFAAGSPLRGRPAVERELREAIAHDQLVLHYQPVVDVVTGALTGAEALVRWQHPELGLIPPVHFVPILEETGLMNEAGRWIFEKACQQAREWEESGLTGLKLAINISACQLRDPSFKAMVIETMERHRLEPSRLELELTETAPPGDLERTSALFADLREAGVRLAIDDFGRGYSSLSQVKNLPFTRLKIDREFVTDINENPDSQAICRALIELARALSIDVQAEGVETVEEVETLRNLGCSTFQGFYFARPLTPEAFAAKARDPEWLSLLASPVHRKIAGLQSRITPRTQQL